MQVKIKNAVQIKKFYNYYKITICNEIRKGNRKVNYVGKGQKNENKLLPSIQRSKKTVMEKAICNEWTWFCTLTLDKEKYQRDDLKKFIKDLSQFIRDYRKKYPDYKLHYLLIPELHSDNVNWHMHGLFSDLPIDDLDVHPLRKEAEKGYVVWKPYNKKFGFSSLGVIKDRTKTALYITKYITKDLNNTSIELNNKLYYCSRGLKTAEMVSQGILIDYINFEMDFEGIYAKAQFVNDYAFFKEFYNEQEF